MTIGPAPMMRMLLMSVRLGIASTSCFHQRRRSGRTGSRCRAGPGSLPGGPGSRTPAGRCARSPAAMPSKSETCVGAQVGRQRRRVDREAVVLAGDHHRPVSRSFTGWFAPWWPNFIFSVFAPEARPMQLVAEADAEHRHAGRVEDLADRLDRVVARLRVARAVGQEHAVGLQRAAPRARASAPAPR